MIIFGPLHSLSEYSSCEFKYSLTTITDIYYMLIRRISLESRLENLENKTNEKSKLIC